MVGVLADVRAVSRIFDYEVPAELEPEVRVGSMVRVDLAGRAVAGWVVDGDREPPEGVALKPIRKVTGWGPPADVTALTDWAAWRWVGPRSGFLVSASPDVAVRGLPRPPQPSPPATVVIDPWVADLLRIALDRRRAVVRIPPAVDLAALTAFVVASAGPSLVLAPTHQLAALIASRLRRQGQPTALLSRDWPAARAGGSTVVGARAAAWAPAPDARCVVVIDAHDEGYQSESAPTWHAVDVAIERARRAGIPCLLVSPCPDLFLTRGRPDLGPSRRDERDGWPIVDVLDRRSDDPRTGLYGERLVASIHRAERSVLVLNRKGRARLLACAACGELARCERCDAAVTQGDESTLACGRCGLSRPGICAKCGSSALKTLRVGVGRAREELEALLGVPVGEVTGESSEVPDANVLIGTEAVLRRVVRADLVAFLDFDQELFAPRYRAAEEALALLALAGRLVGGRRGGGRVAIQTRAPNHDVLAAALHGDPTRVAAAEAPKREALGFPPAAAMAAVSGPSAGAFIERLSAIGTSGLDIVGPADGRWLVRAPDHPTLCDGLAAVERPSGRLRIEVDPRRL